MTEDHRSVASAPLSASASSRSSGQNYGPLEAGDGPLPLWSNLFRQAELAFAQDVFLNLASTARYRILA